MDEHAPMRRVDPEYAARAEALNHASSTPDPAPGPSKRMVPKRARSSTRYRCAACTAEPFAAWLTAQRHANEAHGGARIEVLLQPRTLAPDPRRR